MTQVTFTWTTTASYRLYAFSHQTQNVADAEVNVQGKSHNLPSGRYDLFWRALGAPGAAVELKIEAGGAVLKTLKRKLTPNGTGSGLSSFEVP